MCFVIRRFSNSKRSRDQGKVAALFLLASREEYKEEQPRFGIPTPPVCMFLSLCQKLKFMEVRCYSRPILGREKCLLR